MDGRQDAERATLAGKLLQDAERAYISWEALAYFATWRTVTHVLPLGTSLIWSYGPLSRQSQYKRNLMKPRHVVVC